MPNSAKNSPRRARATERRLIALELRKAGATYQKIAEHLGVPLTTAAYYVTSAMRALVAEPARELRDLEVARLDDMLLSVWPQVRQGNLGAIDRVLRIMERRAKLLGLDAPTRVNVTDWRTQALEDIRAGRLTFDQVVQAFGDDDLAAQLFREAGVEVSVTHDAGEQ